MAFGATPIGGQQGRGAGIGCVFVNCTEVSRKMAEAGKRYLEAMQRWAQTLDPVAQRRASDEADAAMAEWAKLKEKYDRCHCERVA